MEALSGIWEAPEGNIFLVVAIASYVVSIFDQVGSICLKPKQQRRLVCVSVACFLAWLIVIFSPLLSQTFDDLGQPETLKREAREILLDRGKSGIDDARSKFEEAQEYDPEDPQLEYYLRWLDELDFYLNGKGSCENASTRYGRARRLLIGSNLNDSISREMLIEIGHYLSNRDLAHDEAIKLYNLLLNKDPDFNKPVSYMALVSRGMANFWKKEYGTAQRDFEKALSLQASEQVAYNLGSVYAMYKNYPKAIEWYKAAISGGTQKLESLGKAVELQGNSHFPRARRDLGFAILLNQSQGESDEARKDRYTSALKEFRQASRNLKKAEDFSAHIGQGISLFLLNRPAEAQEALSQVPDESSYKWIADVYDKKAEQCASRGLADCIDSYSSETSEVRAYASEPFPQSDGIRAMFGNVTVHDDKDADPLLGLEHAALYVGPCSVPEGT